MAEALTEPLESSISILFCADERYARPLAVALHSVLASVSAADELSLYVVLSDISTDSRRRLERVAARHGRPVTWVDAAGLELGGLRGDRHVTASTYLRLFVDEIMPIEVRRAIFLDSDVLVRRSMRVLYDLPLRGNVIGAVRDMVIADSDHPYSGSIDRGGAAPYFNAGVLLIDLAEWRRRDLGPRLRDYVRERPGHGNFDQEALNDLLKGSWLELDGAWNVQGSLLLLHEHPTHSWVSEMRKRRATLLQDAAIVHFSGSIKPWHASSRHPFRHEWRSALGKSCWFTRTAYAAWRIRLEAESAAARELVRIGLRPGRESAEL